MAVMFSLCRIAVRLDVQLDITAYQSVEELRTSDVFTTVFTK